MTHIKMSSFQGDADTHAWNIIFQMDEIVGLFL